LNIEELMIETPEYQQIRSQIKPNTRQLITGISGSARTLFIKSMLADLSKPILLVTDTLFHADQLVDDLSNVLADDQLFEFPVEEMLAAEVATSSPDYRAQRINALKALIDGKPIVVVVAVSGVKRYLPNLTDFKSNILTIKVGEEYDLEVLQKSLNQMGYLHQKLVDAPGDFAVRGSIVDVYPLNAENPIRIDFFDTEVDSMRQFDSTNQRSIENVDEVTLLPATDLLIPNEKRPIAAQKLQAALDKALKDKTNDEQKDQLEKYISPLIDEVNNGSTDPELLIFADYLFDGRTSVIDYLSNEGVVLFDDYTRLVEADQQLEEDEASWVTDKLKSQQVFINQQFEIPLKDALKTDEHAKIFMALFQKGMGNLRFDLLTAWQTRAMQRFFGQMPLLKAELDRWHKLKQTVVIMVKDEARLNKVAATLQDFKMQATLTGSNNLQKGAVQLITDQLQTGFELPSAGLVVITESEMFKKVTKHRRRRQTLANAERLKSYTDLKPGDYVVHVNHGIGRFEGMQTLEVDGVHQDYMTIDYQKNAKIFIPVTQLNLIQKFVSSEDKKPRVNKLGGSEWAKTKSKVASKIEDIADDLVELYAKREAEKGFAFPRDDAYQEQFDNDFPYSETPDQLRSIEEIKHDMERVRPMDRLLVGDVGYGKTEVALRAAFKAIEAGKQVAFLVPTTILAQQHFDTMTNRFEGYPITIGILSRFQTTKEVNQTIKGLEDGTVDVVVGTHRLLSKDVKFKDLGLLLVDEEQRFGVKHKERIKEIRSDVDVLTLTATPIPRTLHMSMLGVRDLSVIETPPANRFPIQTYVMEQNAGALQDGIHREMQRGGQVFYLHNRVSDIEKTVSQIKALVPDAEVAFIHGKMTEAQLEGVLYDFVRGEYDVLVTTTIIETGIDMPNVNTLFVENADHMGLAQLYQLRGRIGRSNRVAYAYFMYQQNKVLTEVSEKRLEAIKDFTELGSGFKIAMRDLSIRGAGNLLGKQQHGFIDSIGYDLYSQMLADAVAKKQGKAKKARSDATLELGIEAYLPSTYIEDEQQKIEMYKRIRQVTDDEEYYEIEDDLIDRFGEYPMPVANLLKISHLKMQADEALIEKIRHLNDGLIVTLSLKGSRLISGEDIFKALSNTKLKATVGLSNEKMIVKLIIQPKMTEADWLAQLIDFTVGLRKLVLTNSESK